MAETQKVKLEEADFASLKHYAELTLGLEIKTGTNSKQIIAKIQKADSSVEEIPVVETAQEQVGDVVAVPEVTHSRSTTEAIAGKVAPATRAHADPMHSSNDPKVELTVQKTADKTRAKICDIQVNGVVFRIKRGVRVAVPYRVFEALENAKEKQAVDSDELNPVTGEPYKEWEDVLSYPFQVHAMPSEEEVRQWRESTDEGFQRALAA